MKFAVLSARINRRGQVAQEPVIDDSAGKGRVEFCRIDADDHGPEATVEKIADRATRVPSPDRKETGECMACEQPFAVRTHIRQKEIAEDDCLNTAAPAVRQSFLHPRFVFGIVCVP